MGDWTLEIVDARGRGSKTGKGAAFQSEAEARRAFEAARSVASQEGGFLLDLHDAENNLVDTLHLDEAGFEAIVGEPPASVEFYDAWDRSFWRAERARHASSRPRVPPEPVVVRRGAP